MILHTAGCIISWINTSVCVREFLCALFRVWFDRLQNSTDSTELSSLDGDGGKPRNPTKIKFKKSAHISKKLALNIT